LLAEIAKLEHGVRETIVNNGAVSAQRTSANAGANDDALTLKHEREMKKLRKEIADLNEQLETCQQKSVDKSLVANLEADVEKLNRTIKKMGQEQIASENHYKNEIARLEGESKVLQATAEANHKSALEEKGRTDALEKAYAELQKKCAELEVKTVAAAEPKTVAHPLLGKIQEQPPIVTKKEELDDEEEDEAEEEGVDPDSLPDFKHKGVIYKKDADGTLYKDSEEGWELVGRWDEKTKSIVIQEIEEEEEAEEEDDENNLTEFVFKGKTYFLDEENNVFQETDDGYEQVGKWNGKKILLE
jgi:hypothetical protein